MNNSELLEYFYKTLSEQILVLIVFSCIMFVTLIVIFFHILPDIYKKIHQLQSDNKALEDYLEYVRKINLKKRSDEKLILPPMFPKDKIQ